MNKKVLLIVSNNCFVNGSFHSLISAFENIIRNGIRFTLANTSVVVKVFTQNHIVQISITDSGSGVPDDALPFLFEPFYRVDETRGEDNSGSGLGLAISYAIIKKHNGKISVKNNNPGLKVNIILPITTVKKH